MSEETKQRQRHFDRVTIDSAGLARIDAWISQVEAFRPGVQLSRKGLLNWLVENLPEKLTSTQEKALSEEFYSELRYLQFAAREIKAAEARGERLTLKDLEQRGASVREPTKRKREKKPAEGDVIEPIPGEL